MVCQEPWPCPALPWHLLLKQRCKTGWLLQGQWLETADQGQASIGQAWNTRQGAGRLLASVSAVALGTCARSGVTQKKVTCLGLYSAVTPKESDLHGWRCTLGLSDTLGLLDHCCHH